MRKHNATRAGFFHYLLISLVVITGFFSIVGSGGEEENGCTPIDVEGVWEFYFTKTKIGIAGTFGPYLGVFEQSGNDITFTIDDDEGVGTIVCGEFADVSDIAFSWTDDEGFYTATGIANTFMMSGDWEANGAPIGTWRAEKGNAFATLYYLDAEAMSILSIAVYTKDADRVYLTGDYITGEIELSNCDTVQGYQYWQISASGECTPEDNRYDIEETVAFPLYITVHVVDEKGDETEDTVRINGDEAVYEYPYQLAG